MSLLMIFIPYYLLLTSDPGDITAYIAVMIVGIFFLLLSFWIVATFNPTTDRIFENGVTSTDHNLFDYLGNKTFTPFNRITRIGTGIGVTPVFQDRFRFIAIYIDGKKRNATTLTDQYCQEGFFEKLEEMLAIKCTRVPWVPMEWKPP